MDTPDTNQNSFSRMAPAAVAFAITASFIFIPVLGALIISFLPAPIAYARQRYGLVNSSFTAFLPSAFAFSATGSVLLASMVMLFCVSGYIMGVAMAAGEPSDRAIMKASLYPLLFAAPVAAVYFTAAGVNPMTLLERGLDMSLQESIKIYRQMGMSQSDIDSMMPNLRLVANAVTDFFPAITVWTMVAAAAVSLSALNSYMARKGMPGVQRLQLTAWYAPDMAVWGIIVPGFLMIPDYHLLRVAAGNVLGSVAILYLFQGFAVTIYLFDRIRLTGFLRALSLVIVMLQPLLILAMWALGFFDTWVDFRKTRPGAKPPQ